MLDIPTTPGIYAIINNTNGKLYIGSAVNLRGRKNNHFSYLARDCHTNRHLQNAVNKYGLSAFSFHVIELVDDNDVLLQREQCYIDETGCCDDDKGYNSCPTAGSNLGVKCSNETKAKMSAANRGEKHPQWGTRRSEETRAKISKALLGKKLSDEHRQKMSEAALRRYRAERDNLQLMLDF